jgi:ribonuclease D
MKDDRSPAYQIIAEQSGAEAFARSLEKENIIAVDLEADSMYHFQEKICLIQIATRTANVIMDPLKIPNLRCLAPLFADTHIQKIFHGADYDIRCLDRDLGITVNNLFDTQIAARFLGFHETGLEAVIQNQFGAALDKRYQKKDWSKRPLSPDMLEYAARDTVYLISLAEFFRKELQKKGRLEWVIEECEHLSRVRSGSNDNGPLFLKFKGAGRLKPRSLAILEALLQVRKEIAMKKDRPPFKVFGQDSAIKLITERPLTLDHLKKINALSNRQIGSFGPEIIRAITIGMEVPEEKLPIYPKTKKPVVSPRVPERIKNLKAWRDEKAARLDIDPALICSKFIMNAIAEKNPIDITELVEIEGMKNWQRETFGREIIDLLNSMNEKKGKQKKRRRKGV